MTQYESVRGSFTQHSSGVYYAAWVDLADIFWGHYPQVAGLPDPASVPEGTIMTPQEVAHAVTDVKQVGVLSNGILVIGWTQNYQGYVYIRVDGGSPKPAYNAAGTYSYYTLDDVLSPGTHTICVDVT